MSVNNLETSWFTDEADVQQMMQESDVKLEISMQESVIKQETEEAFKQEPDIKSGIIKQEFDFKEEMFPWVTQCPKCPQPSRYETDLQLHIRLAHLVSQESVFPPATIEESNE